MSPRQSCLILGRGRAGQSFHAALKHVGWSVRLVAGRDTVSPGAVDLILLAVPDDAVADVAAALPATTAVVAHVSGSLPLTVLEPHDRIGSIHPLMSLPDGTIGGERLLDACTYAVAGDALMREVATQLGGRPIEVADDRRALYHAVAAIASNHVTALCAQVERLAEQIGVPADAYWTLLRTTVDNVEVNGAAQALTGPAARGDWGTVEGHLRALPDGERDLYLALCAAAAALAGRALPDHLGGGGTD